MSAPVVNFEWAAQAPIGSFRCISCESQFVDGDGGRVFDKENFMAMCKGCWILIVQNAATQWPEEVLTAYAEGLKVYVRRRSEDAASQERDELFRRARANR